jgi:hypothetical protein
MLTEMLEVAVGLGLVYLLAAMFCSGLWEMLARVLKARGRLLREGLLRLVPDRWVYLRTLNHPLLAGLYRGSPASGALPSYLPGSNFARALTDVLLRSQGQATELTLENLRSAIATARQRDLAIGHALMPVVGGAHNLEQALRAVEDWYDSAMDRVGGWYKARSQKMLFVLGLATAMAFNLDSIQISTALARSAELRAVSTAAAQRLSAAPLGASSVDAAREELRSLGAAGFPIGYGCLGTQGATRTPAVAAGAPTSLWTRCADTVGELAVGDWVLKLAGWLITAVAVSLGAPFWFDLLGRMVDPRQSGRRPPKSAADQPAGK